MQGKHLTHKERFYIEKRWGDGVNQATIARELELPRSRQQITSLSQPVITEIAAALSLSC